MIQNFRKITNSLYRGSAPTPHDVLMLKKHLGINKIVSLDEKTGLKIDRACQMLGIKHIMLPIDFVNLHKTVFNCLKHNLKNLLIDDGPTFVHCQAGKDRTGFIIALFKCKYMGMDPEKAIEEAKSFGFGIKANVKMIKLFEKLIRSCKKSEDNNTADIVSNEREYISDNRDSFLDEGHQGSFAPYLNETKQNPMDAVYNYINDQSPTRENYQSIKEHEEEENKDVVPLVGLFNNDAGGRGFGPTENYGGFFYD